METKPDSPAKTTIDVAPAADLIAWLDANAEQDGHPALFNVPVVAVFTDRYRLKLSRAFIGSSALDRGDDKVAVEFDDSTLGVGLFRQMRRLCDNGSPVCAIWVKAHWGPRLADSGKPIPPGANPNARLLYVRGVGDVVEPGTGVGSVSIVQ